ncbi:MAG: S9 family peptidase [Dehalococcoidia bacterium]|nr:S9 family peptidase [Dehalococcoidia bacterium]
MPAKKRKLTPEDFYLLRNVVDPQVSPDGRLAAYVVAWPDRETDETRSSVYVAPLDGRSPARRFTQGNKDHSPRWSPDGRHLAFVSERGEKNQLFVAPMDGGEPRQVTRQTHGVSQPAWSPDGKRIAYAARTGDWTDPKERKGAQKNAPRVIRDLRYKLDGVGFFDARRLHIFAVDVASGEEQQVTAGDWHDDQPAWSPDGKLIAFVSDRERQRHQRQWRTDVWVTPVAGGRARKVTRGRGSASHPAFSPDGRRIAFAGHEHGDEGVAKNIHLMVVPVEGGSAPRSLSAATDRPVAGWPAFMSGRTFAWTAAGDGVLFLAGDRGTQALYRAGLSNGAVSKALDGERQIEAFSPAPDGRRVAFTAAWPSAPWELYSARLNPAAAPGAGGRRREVNLSHANDELMQAVEMGPLRRLTCEAPDGLEIEAFALYPPDYRKGRRYPLALNVHGGPHSFHPGSRSLVEFQSLAAAGYVVLLPNPRGSTTYGEEFSEGVVKDWGGKDFEDIMAGVNALVQRGVADPARLYIGGYSYGGFMSSWAVGRTDRFRAAVVGAPVSNQVSMFGTGDIPLFDMHEIGGTPQDNPEEYQARSPVTYMADVRTPVLLVHHEGDLRCPIGQSEEIFQALRMAGKEVEFVRYPGGFHTYNTHAPSQVVDRVRRTIAWYAGHAPKAKGRPPARRRAKARAGR